MLGKPTYEELEQRIRELEPLESEWKKAEEEFQSQLQYYRDLMDVSLDGIAIIDQGHRVREANRRFAQMLGYTMEEVFCLHTWDWEAIMKEAEIRERFSDLSQTKTTFETRHRRKDGTVYEAEVTACGTKLGEDAIVLTITRDITERKRSEREMKDLISRLQKAMKDVKTLSGLLPICSSCKKIRDDKGYWKQIESYISDHSEAEFSHSICQECEEKLYGDQDWYRRIKNNADGA